MKFDYDVIIAGSGAGGGFCAMTLAQKGLKVLVLEKGKRYDFKKDFPMNHSNWETQFQPLNQSVKTIDHSGSRARIDTKDSDICSTYFDPNAALYNKIPSHRGAFRYSRVLGVGGSTLHYQGEAHRFPEHAFKPKSLFGWGEDWPISYNDLAPFYAQAENVLGVAGHPDNPFKPARDSFPTPHHPLSTASQVAYQGAKKLGWSLLPNSLALPSKSIDGRLPCQHSGGCVQGCIFGAKSSVDLTAIKIAEDTGNLSLLTQSSLVNIESSSADNISGFTYALDGEFKTVTAKVYVLGLGAIETPRILLASSNRLHPRGIGNQHDQVGRNFMETIIGVLNCQANEALHSYKGPPLDSRIWDFAKPNKPLKSGYVLGVSGTIGTRLSPYSYAQFANEFGGGVGFGLEHKTKVRQQFGRDIQFLGIAEHIPHPDNTVSLSKKTDALGIPLVHVYSDYGTEDKETLAHMLNGLKKWANECDVQSPSRLYSSYDNPLATHVGGTCRMGEDITKSVVNRYGKVHNINNLFITDASVLPSQGAGDSPSLTIQALTINTAEHIAKLIG